MRGRKRHRKKDEKKRGVWGLPIIVTPLRGRRDRERADMLARFLSRKISERDRIFRAELVRNFLAAIGPNSLIPIEVTLRESGEGESASSRSRVPPPPEKR